VRVIDGFKCGVDGRDDRSALGEFLDKRAGFWQLRFIIGGGRRIAAVAQCRKSRLDLLNRQFRHLGIAAPFREEHERDTLNAGALGPVERHTRAGIFLQGVAIGGNGLFEPRRPALPLAERYKRSAEIVLGGGPLERRARR
jgi:hypothetical protein